MRRLRGLAVAVLLLAPRRPRRRRPGRFHRHRIYARRQVGNHVVARLPRLHLDGAVRESPEADLRSLQILEDRDRPAREDRPPSGERPRRGIARNSRTDDRNAHLETPP